MWRENKYKVRAAVDCGIEVSYFGICEGTSRDGKAMMQIREQVIKQHESLLRNPKEWNPICRVNITFFFNKYLFNNIKQLTIISNNYTIT